MSVEVKLELGHRAVMRDRVTQEGFTHDWTVFVRGAEGNNIQFFVEKVVFHLHESFPKPKRVVKEPPYSVSESGYAGFIMPIDVYFRSREEPKKVNFKYDLYLKLESSPVSNIRIEKLTFQNPSDDFRNKLVKAGGLAGALSGSAAGGSASLSTQACAPPQHVDDYPPISHPKPVVAEKKPRPHVPCKEIKSSQPPTPKQPSQPFTDIFGAPIRTKNSPDSSSTKSKDSGSSSQFKSKNTPNSSSTTPAKEGRSSSKEFHKSKDGHHSTKDSRHTSKDSHQSSKDNYPLKEPHPSSKDCLQEKDSHQSKDSHTPKEGHTIKEIHHKAKEHHSKEGHKKENHHSSKEVKSSKDPLSSDSKVSKSSKPIKSDKESKSVVKRAAPTDSHGSHGNAEKKKKLSPVSSESSDKSSSQPKHKTKEGKEKTEKQKTKPLSNFVKKEEEKPKHKSSPAPPSEPVEPKEMPKPKPPISPPPILIRPPSPPSSPPPKSPSPISGSLYSGSDDESSKSLYKAHYSSPASSISESSLHSNIPQLSDHSIISPLSDDSNDDFLPPSKRKINSDHDLDDASPEPKPVESKPPKLNKKQHAHSKSSKHKSENFHRGNGSINNDISMNHMPAPELQDISNHTVPHNNNTAYREELLRLQRTIMSLNDRRLVQNIVDLIETTGKYEITSTTFDFDLCSLDYAIIQKIKHCLERLL